MTYAEIRRVKIESLVSNYLKTMESLDTAYASLEAFPFLHSLFTQNTEYNGFTLIDTLFLSKLGDVLKECSHQK